MFIWARKILRSYGYTEKAIDNLILVADLNSNPAFFNGLSKARTLLDKVKFIKKFIKDLKKKCTILIVVADGTNPEGKIDRKGRLNENGIQKQILQGFRTGEIINGKERGANYEAWDAFFTDSKEIPGIFICRGRGEADYPVGQIYELLKQLGMKDLIVFGSKESLLPTISPVLRHLAESEDYPDFPQLKDITTKSPLSEENYEVFVKAADLFKKGELDLNPELTASRTVSLATKDKVKKDSVGSIFAGDGDHGKNTPEATLTEGIQDCHNGMAYVMYKGQDLLDLSKQELVPVEQQFLESVVKKGGWRGLKGALENATKKLNDRKEMSEGQLDELRDELLRKEIVVELITGDMRGFGLPSTHFGYEELEDLKPDIKEEDQSNDPEFTKVKVEPSDDRMEVDPPSPTRSTNSKMSVDVKEEIRDVKSEPPMLEEIPDLEEQDVWIIESGDIILDTLEDIIDLTGDQDDNEDDGVNVSEMIWTPLRIRHFLYCFDHDYFKLFSLIRQSKQYVFASAGLDCLWRSLLCSIVLTGGVNNLQLPAQIYEVLNHIPPVIEKEVYGIHLNKVLGFKDILIKVALDSRRLIDSPEMTTKELEPRLREIEDEIEKEKFLYDLLVDLKATPSGGAKPSSGAAASGLDFGATPLVPGTPFGTPFFLPNSKKVKIDSANGDFDSLPRSDETPFKPTSRLPSIRAARGSRSTSLKNYSDEHYTPVDEALDAATKAKRALQTLQISSKQEVSQKEVYELLSKFIELPNEYEKPTINLIRTNCNILSKILVKTISLDINWEKRTWSSKDVKEKIAELLPENHTQQDLVFPVVIMRKMLTGLQLVEIESRAGVLVFYKRYLVLLESLNLVAGKGVPKILLTSPSAISLITNEKWPDIMLGLRGFEINKNTIGFQWKLDDSGTRYELNRVDEAEKDQKQLNPVTSTGYDGARLTGYLVTYANGILLSSRPKVEWSPTIIAKEDEDKYKEIFLACQNGNPSQQILQDLENLVDKYKDLTLPHPQISSGLNSAFKGGVLWYFLFHLSSSWNEEMIKDWVEPIDWGKLKVSEAMVSWLGIAGKSVLDKTVEEGDEKRGYAPGQGLNLVKNPNSTSPYYGFGRRDKKSGTPFTIPFK